MLFLRWRLTPTTEGNQIAKLDGNIDETLTVAGSSITARLTSDGSVTKDGVTVTITSL